MNKKWNRKKFIKETIFSNKLSLLIIFIVTATSSAIDIYLPKYFGNVLENFDQKDLFSKFNIEKGKIILAIALVTIIIQVFSQLSENLFNYNFKKKWLPILIDKVLNINYQTFIKSQSGYLNKRVLEDLKSIPLIFTSSSSFSLFFDTLVIVVAGGFMVKLLPKVTIVLLSMIIVGGVIGIFVFKYARKWYHEIAEIWSVFAGFFNQVIANYVMIKGFKVEKNAEELLKTRLNKILNRSLKIQFILLGVILFLSLLFLGIIIFGVYYALISSKELSVEVIVSYFGFLWILVQRVMNILNSLANIQEIIVYLDRTIQILNLPSKVLSRSKIVSPINSIEFKNFKKKIAEKTIFENINFRVEKGDIISVIGDSGTGKTTLLRSIFGLIDNKEGEIVLNDSITVEDLMNNTNTIYLPQELFLFSGTLQDNFDIFNGKYDLGEIKELLQKLNLTSRIDLEKILNMKIEESGKNISGGEKQRIIFLSILLKDPDIIILDEPTSQVDIATENIIKEIIANEAKKGKIIFIVGHRENLTNISSKIFDIAGKKLITDPAN